jgi:hypothetical protein
MTDVRKVIDHVRREVQDGAMVTGSGGSSAGSDDDSPAGEG